MSEINIFGRDLPLSVKKEPEIKPNERHEAIREQLYARIIRDATATQHFIEWIDSVRVEQSVTEVEETLVKQVEKVFADIPTEEIERIREWRRIRDEETEMFGVIEDTVSEEDAVGLLKALDSNEEYVRLSDEADRLEELVKNHPDLELVLQTDAWTHAILEAHKEVSAFKQKPELARLAVNQLFKNDGETPLKKDEIIRTIFEPFAVQFVLTSKAYDRLTNLSLDTIGFYRRGTSFAFVLEHQKKKRNHEQETIRHESAHRVIDRAHSHGHDLSFQNIDRSLEWVKTHSASPEGSLQRDILLPIAKKNFLKAIQVSAIDALHNEFIAELINARFQRNEVLSRWHWATAENAAKQYSKVVTHSIEQIKQFDPVFADELEKKNIHILKQFARAKQSVVRALQLAQFLPDPNARAFVVAAAFVMPIRSYHHLPEILRRTYSEAAMQKAEQERFVDDLLYGGTIPGFERLNQFLLTQTSEEKGIKSIRWFDVMSSVRDAFVEDWKITSLGILIELCGRMEKWPDRFISDPENSPMREIAHSFFDHVVDAVWRDGVPHVPCDPVNIQKHPYLQAGFIDSLQVSLNGEFYSDDLSLFLGLTDRNPTREEVLSSAMAIFCEKAGVKKEFDALVEKYVPVDTTMGSES